MGTRTFLVVVCVCVCVCVCVKEITCKHSASSVPVVHKKQDADADSVLAIGIFFSPPAVSLHIIILR